MLPEPVSGRGQRRGRKRQPPGAKGRWHAGDRSPAVAAGEEMPAPMPPLGRAVVDQCRERAVDASPRPPGRARTEKRASRPGRPRTGTQFCPAQPTATGSPDPARPWGVPGRHRAPALPGAARSRRAAKPWHPSREGVKGVTRTRGCDGGFDPPLPRTRPGQGQAHGPSLLALGPPGVSLRIRPCQGRIPGRGPHTGRGGRCPGGRPSRVRLHPVPVRVSTGRRKTGARPCFVALRARLRRAARPGAGTPGRLGLCHRPSPCERVRLCGEARYDRGETRFGIPHRSKTEATPRKAAGHEVCAPRTWGWPPMRRAFPLPRLVRPTHAGVAPVPPVPDQPRQRAPHTRGDGPGLL